MKNITLFWPPIPNGPLEPIYPSLGMAYLDAEIREKFNSTVVDSNLLFPISDFYKHINERKFGIGGARKAEEGILLKLLAIVEKIGPDFLCIGSWTYNMPFVAEFSRKFKARNPDVPIILGGINPTLVPEETLAVLPYIDYLVRGEGEITLKDLLLTLEKTKKVSKVKGISFIRNKKVVHTANRVYIPKLDKLKLMDYENFYGFKEWHKKNRFSFVQVMTSRGCVASCSFCTVHQMWKAQRFYSPQYVAQQIKHLLGLYNYAKDTIAFMDDNFVVSFKKTKHLVDYALDKFPGYDWQVVDMRIDALSDEFLDYCKEKKCTFLGFGVESTNANSLRYMNKTLNPAQYKSIVLKLLKKAEQAEIRTMLSSIIGLPNETERDMINQSNFFIHIFNTYKYAAFDVCPLVVHPATPLYEEYREGRLSVYRRPHGSPKRFYEGLFADKWDHLLCMVPNAYRVQSNVMPKAWFERVLHTIFKEKLSVLGPVAKEKYGQIREKQDFVRH